MTPTRTTVMILAVSVGALASACSDNGGAEAPDAAKPDASGGVHLDAGNPDVPAVDVGAPDVPLGDAPLPDGPALDGGVVDGRRVDVIDAPASDVPSADSAAVDVGAVSPLARGKYLVDHVIACSDCHTPKLPSGAPDMSKYLAGNPTFVVTPAGDVLASRNLTPDPTTGLGSFTADQIQAMLMNGVVPTATGVMALNPVMPYYVFHNMKAEDAKAIVAYLQSIPAVSNLIPDRSPAFDVAAPATYLDPATIPTPADSYPEKDSALRGRYLAAQSGVCVECHTPHLSSGSMPIDTKKLFQGGEDFSALFAGTLNIHPISANLTSDPTTGIGTWTTHQIITALKQGKDEDGMGICPPMPVGPDGAFGGLTDQDALDIANYLKSLPPAINDVPDMCSWPPPPPPMDGGSIDGSGGGVDGPGMDVESVDVAASG